MNIKALLGVTSITLLAACGGQTTTQSADPAAMGADMSSAARVAAAWPSGAYQDLSGNGYSFAVAEQSNSLVAAASILPDATVADLPTTGGATYAGEYRMVHVNQIAEGDDGMTGSALVIESRISLDANFAEGTLTGSSGNLTVNGQFNGSDLTGDVAFSGVTGTLDGIIGSDKAIGAFQGSDANETYAGGFYVTPEN